MAKPAHPTTPNSANDAGAPRPEQTSAKRVQAREAVERARTTASDTAVKVRAAASDALNTSAQAVDNAPLTALAGAIAVGAVAAALIPTSARELKTLGPLGRKARGALDDAFQAAKAAGADQLTAKGMTGTALTAGLGTVAGHLLSASFAATSAASETVRQRRAREKKEADRANGSA